MVLVYRTAAIGRYTPSEPARAEVLGDVRRGIDGLVDTDAPGAVCPLRFDLLHNDGSKPAV